MRNRGITRGRMFMGGLLLFAAVIAWFTGLWLNPSAPTSTAGIDGIRGTVVTVIRKSAIWTLTLSALSAWLLFPARRPNSPKRDYAILAVITVLIASSIYQLAWLQISVLR